MVLTLLGFVSQGLWAAQSQAEIAACCDPSMKAMMQMSHDDMDSADTMSEMPCHDVEQSCDACCQSALQQTSGLVPAVSAYVPNDNASRATISPSNVLAGRTLESIPHPPNT